MRKLLCGIAVLFSLMTIMAPIAAHACEGACPATGGDKP
jgi:hypothetical protein